MSKFPRRLREDEVVVLAESEELLDLDHASADPARPDVVRRFELATPVETALRLSVEARADGILGPPGEGCMIFFNVEYVKGPVFWDTFLYPDTGSTPWRVLACEARGRGAVKAVEMHIRFRGQGRLRVRRPRVEAIPEWAEDAEALVALFGDSTDMTNYLPPDLRLGRRLELLLRDRFSGRRVDVRDLAEGGEYLQRLLESGRLERELRTLPRCDIATIRYGLNDASRKIEPAAFRTQLDAACDCILARFPRARIVLATTIPTDTSAGYDRQAEAVARARNLHLIPLDRLLRERSAAGDSDWHHQPGSRIGRRRTANPPDNPDGLAGDKHPNAYGAQMMAEYYFESLEPILAGLLEALGQS